MFAVISSLAAAAFMALAAFMLDLPVVVILLSLASSLAWVSHSDAPVSARAIGHYAALALGIVSFFILVLNL